MDKKELTINILDYVEKEEIADIIRDEVRNNLRNMSEKNFTRILTNSQYDVITKYIEEMYLDKEIPNMKEKVKEIISDLSSYTVFRKATYGEKESKGMSLINEFVEEEKEVIRQKVKNIINEEYYSYKTNFDMAELASDVVYELFNLKKEELSENGK